MVNKSMFLVLPYLTRAETAVEIQEDRAPPSSLASFLPSASHNPLTQANSLSSSLFLFLSQSVCTSLSHSLSLSLCVPGHCHDGPLCPLWRWNETSPHQAGTGKGKHVCSCCSFSGSHQTNKRLKRPPRLAPQKHECYVTESYLSAQTHLRFAFPWDNWWTEWNAISRT